MKKLTILMFALLVVVSSCKKEKTEENAASSDCKPVKISFSEKSGDDIVDLIYDAQNRIASLKSDGVEQLKFSYSNTEIVSIETVIEPKQTYNVTTTYKLDAQGRIISAATTSSTGANIGTTAYTYNTDGYLTDLVETTSNKTLKYKLTYSNGNLTSVTSQQVGYPESVDIFEYSTELAPASYMSLGAVDGMADKFDGFLANYMGKRSKNLLIKGTNADDKSVSTVVYKKDTKGNITSAEITETTSKYTDKFSVNYEYSCK